MKHWIQLIALLLVVLFCFTACGVNDEGQEPETPDTNDSENGDTTPDGETPESDEKPEEQKPVLLDPSQAMILADNRKTDYVIVCDDALTSTIRQKITNFKNMFWNKTGADLTIKKDTAAEQAKEILIYAMNDRNEVSNLMRSVTAPEGRGYIIKMVGDKIVVACDDAMYLESALNLLLSAVSDCGNNVWGIRLGYEGKLDIPAPVTSATSRVQSLYTGEGNYTISVTNATKKNYEDYAAKLDRSMELYSENKIGDNLFATYVVDTTRGKMAAYTMYYPNDKCYKVTYGPLGYLPAQSADSSTKVTPSITQNGRDGCKEALGYSAAGMCTIIQLSDGRFIIFDGGPYSANDSSNKDDLDELYNLLKSMTPGGGKPVVAAWLFSHAHGDHMGLATKFLDKYHGQFELQMVGHNFPDFDSIKIVNESPSGMKSNVTAFYEKLNTYFPKTKTWVCHTGEKLMLPDCELEVIYTPEDYGTDPDLGAQTDGTIEFPWGNHACSVFRLTVKDTVLLVLGDAEKTLCKWMADNYKTALKSDILSLSHHGLNGGELSCYQYIDPDVCFWPIDEARMTTDKCRQYDFNKYLLNIGGYGTRKREHYCADTTKTIYC